MNERVKLKELSLTGFRGSLGQIPLSLGEDCRSLVLFGNNGDGKSSFSDAVEWFFMDTIEHLRREGCGREDYFNYALPETQEPTVALSFNKSNLDSVKSLLRKGGYRYSNASDEFREYLGSSCRESLILRYHTMRSFVDKRKRDKLEEIEEIIGFETVQQTRDTLLRALNALKTSTELTELRVLLNEKGNEIAGIIGTKPFIEGDVLSYADKLRECIGHDKAIDSVDTLTSIADELYERVRITERGEEMILLQHVRDDISALKNIPDLLSELAQVLTAHNRLAGERERVEASVLDKLYRAGAEALEKGWARVGECPLCKQPVDTDQLVESLKKEIESIQGLVEERNKTVDRMKSVRDRLVPVKEALSSWLEDEAKKSLLPPHDLSTLQKWLDQFTRLRDLADKVERSPEFAVFELPSEDEHNELKTALTRTEEATESKRSVLAGTEDEKRFYHNVQTLKVLRDSYLRLSRIQVEVQTYDKQITSLEKIRQEFEKREREGLSKILDAISGDVNAFFGRLHPGEDFRDIELALTEARGLEFTMNFYGRSISPPLKALSESHLNSLGIALFLAAARHMNKVNGFVVLDDVVSSFDANHRRALARLLRDEFHDTQFLLLTHDDLWFDLLKQDLPQSRWLFKELARWSHENGIELLESPLALRERVQCCLDTNDANGAANKCRTLIEGVLKQKCEDLGVRLEYCSREKNDQREAGELMDGLAQYLKGNQSLREKQNKLVFSDLKAGQLLTNIGSHHRNLTVTSLARGDIETVLTDVAAFEALFVCPSCTKPAKKSYSPRNSRLKQCQCGNLQI